MDGTAIFSLLTGFLTIFYFFYRFGILPQFDVIKKKVEENAKELDKHSSVLNEHSDRLSRLEENVKWLRQNSDNEQD